MFQVIVMWNLARPDQELSDVVNNIKLRGYSRETFITGEFAWKIAEDKIKPLSVSDIADKYCPTRRDLYFKKGVNRLTGRDRRGVDTWGSKAGYFVEEYIRKIIESAERDGMNTNVNYTNIIEMSDDSHNNYININKRVLEELNNLEETEPSEEGNTEWLIKLLKGNGRAEFALNYLNEILKEDMSVTDEKVLLGKSIDVSDGNLRLDYIKQIGINLPATPDFIIPKYGIVGDIKTGIEFKPHFQLTCTGYALAYENVKGEGNNINWGIIYFFPTRNPSLFRKSITFAQVYIFPIDDYLRREFLTKRDEAYSIISKREPPNLPKENEREYCKYCRFKNFCIRNGLEVER